MSAQIIDGRKLAEEIRRELAPRLAALKERGITPGLCAVLVGEDPASAIYVRNKTRACAEVGIFSQTLQLPPSIGEDELLGHLQRLNQDLRYHGILVQLPLPPHIHEDRIIAAVSPAKDVDGFHPVNLGRLLLGEPIFVPCTPGGVQQMLLRSGHDPAGKHVVICGRSNIVGKPLAALLMQKRAGANATVTVCHTATPDLAAYTRQADILIVAARSPRLITAPMVKEGAVVIDVGINRVPDPSAREGWRWVGDVDFPGVKEVAAAISPVPGGVGPMTVAMLLSNTVKAAELSL